MRRLQVFLLAFIADRANPDTEITDSRLRAAWLQYQNILRPAGGSDRALECTDRAEQHLSREGVIDSRLHVRPFRYLPPAVLAIGALHLTFAVIDATSAEIHLSQLLVAIRPASVVAAAAMGIAVMMWLIQAQTLSWLSSILRATWLDLDAAFMKASAAATDTDKSISEKFELLQAGLEALRAPIQQLSIEQAEASVNVLQSINLLRRESCEKEASEHEELEHKLGKIVSTLANDTKAIGEFHLATAHQLADQSRTVLHRLAEDVKAHASSIGDLGRSEIGLLTAEAQQAIDGLRSVAAEHQEAMRISNQTLRTSAGELAASVQLIGDGATNLKDVAKEFLRAGMGLTGAFEESASLTAELRAALEAMTKSSGDIEKMADDYNQSRDTFAAIAEELGSFLEGARQERDSRGQTAKKLEDVCRKLVEIQERSFKGMESHHARVAGTLTALHKPAADLSAGLRAVNSSTDRLVMIARDLAKRSVLNETDTRADREKELEQALDAFRAKPAFRRTAYR